MRIPGLKTARMAGRWLRSRLGRHVLILGYHRITESPHDPYVMRVRPANFADHLAVLRRCVEPMSLAALGRALQDGTLPRRAVVITFDDGYADVLHQARPLLEQYDMPATAFITTGHLGREFWWEELGRLLLSPAVLPDHLALPINGRAFEWDLLDPAHLTLRKGTPSPRYRLLGSLYHRLLALPAERPHVLAQLEEWARSARPVRREEPTHAMSPEQLCALAEGGLVDIGSHSTTHSILNALPLEMQRREVADSKATLEAVLGRSISSFSYPHGSATATTRVLLRESGYHLACGSHNDVIRPGSDPLYLPRFWVPDWDSDAFERWLRRWL